MVTSHIRQGRHVTSTGQTRTNPRAVVTGINKQGRAVTDRYSAARKSFISRIVRGSLQETRHFRLRAGVRYRQSRQMDPSITLRDCCAASPVIRQGQTIDRRAQRHFEADKRCGGGVAATHGGGLAAQCATSPPCVSDGGRYSRDADHNVPRPPVRRADITDAHDRIPSTRTRRASASSGSRRQASFMRLPPVNINSPRQTDGRSDQDGKGNTHKCPKANVVCGILPKTADWTRSVRAGRHRTIGTVPKAIVRGARQCWRTMPSQRFVQDRQAHAAYGTTRSIRNVHKFWASTFLFDVSNAFIGPQLRALRITRVIS